MNRFAEFVSEFVAGMEKAGGAQLGGYPPCPKPDLPADAPTAMIFSPHPDDECIVGGLALRLLREARMRVVNVAVTQGSNPARQAPRFDELRGACDYLGIELIQVQEGGLEKINRKGKAAMPENWAAAVDKIATIIRQEAPSVVFIPHDKDANTTHVGTHDLVLEALAKIPGASCYTVETEFWGAIDTPNLMVEISADDLADLITALSFHVGEVERNPYHLGLPSWMRDNVRRGGELVGGQGGAVPDFPFATLYRLRKWENGALTDVLEAGRIVSKSDDVAALFNAGM